MFQEIITYMIIGAALAVVILRTLKKFGRKRIRSNNLDFKNETFSLEHNCSDCSAECMLRDTVNPKLKKHTDLCKKIDIR